MNTDSLARALASAALGATSSISYEKITDKPTINEIEVSGNKSGIDYGLQNIINADNKISVNFIDGLIDIDTLSKYYTKTQINDLLENIEKITIEIVETLPTTGDTNVIYLVPKTQSLRDSYDEYIYINSQWEKIGNTDIDLSQYYNKQEVDSLLANKQSTLTNGNGILLDNNNIRAKIDNNTIKFNSDGQLIVGGNVQYKDDRVTTITSSSSDNQYPTAKAVYNLFHSLVDADEERY